MINKDIKYNPNFIIHPGKTLDENLEFIKMSQVELSLRTGLGEKHISQIINGESPITPDTAIKLERAIGISAEFWNSLQGNYDIAQSRILANKRDEQEVAIAKKYNYKELVSFGLVEDTNILIEQVKNLFNFFRVNSLKYITQIKKIAFRQSNGNINNYSLSSWLRFGEIESEKIKNVGKFDKAKLKEKLIELKKLTFLPNNFYKSLQDACAECGVLVVFTPYFKNTKVNGAVRWIGDNPLIQLNSRGTYSDIFWFTFFHEIGHILLHGKKENFLDFDKNTKNIKEEKEADKFAANILISENRYEKLILKKSLSIDDAKYFADSEGVDFGVLIGRFAHDNLLSWSKAKGFRKKINIC